MRRTPAAGIAISLVVALAGCATDEGAGGPTVAGPTTAAMADAPITSPSASATPERKAPRFGKAFVYAAGLRVRIAPPHRFRPSPWIERQPGVPMFFDVVVLNHTGEEWNPSQLHLRLTCAFRRAVQIYDAEKGIVARPEERVPDGRAARFRVAYWVTDRDRLALELSPGFGYQSVTITS